MLGGASCASAEMPPGPDEQQGQRTCREMLHRRPSFRGQGLLFTMGLREAETDGQSSGASRPLAAPSLPMMLAT